MNKKTNTHSYGTYHYYRCATARKMKKSACSNHTIRIDKLELAVTVTLQKMIDTAVELADVLERINKSPKRKKESSHLQKSLASLIAERDKTTRLQIDLYPDWKAGVLSQQEYMRMKAVFGERIARLEEQIRSTEKTIAEYAKGLGGENPFINAFQKYGNITQLTRPMLVELIEEILVYEGGAIEVHFKFQDAYAQVLEYIELNKDTLAVPA